MIVKGISFFGDRPNPANQHGGQGGGAARQTRSRPRQLAVLMGRPSSLPVVCLVTQVGNWGTGSDDVGLIQSTQAPLTASHLHCTAGSSRSFTAIRKDAGLCCGSRLRSGEVFAYVGLSQNLKDLKDHQSTLQSLLASSSSVGSSRKRSHLRTFPSSVSAPPNSRTCLLQRRASCCSARARTILPSRLARGRRFTNHESRIPKVGNAAAKIVAPRTPPRGLDLSKVGFAIPFFLSRRESLSFLKVLYCTSLPEAGLQNWNRSAACCLQGCFAHKKTPNP